MNLNHQVPLITEVLHEWPPVQTTITANQVDVHFSSLDQRCLEYIDNADFVVGCMAWLTHREILKKLATKECLLVVQKEDFLRPDCCSYEELHQLYEQIPAIPWSMSHRRNRIIPYLSELNRHDGTVATAIRCMGNYNADKVPAFSRMHHKFLIFGRKEVKKIYVPQSRDVEEYRAETIKYVPTSVWTGSFNMTYNGTQSRENAVVLYDSMVVQAYYKEFCNIYAMSEPLDWSSQWIAPTYRIGT